MLDLSLAPSVRGLGLNPSARDEYGEAGRSLRRLPLTRLAAVRKSELLRYKLIDDNLCNKEVSFGAAKRGADRKSANLKPDARGRKDSGTSLQSFHRSYSSQG